MSFRGLFRDIALRRGEFSPEETERITRMIKENDERERLWIAVLTIERERHEQANETT